MEIEIWQFVLLVITVFSAGYKSGVELQKYKSRKKIEKLEEEIQKLSRPDRKPPSCIKPKNLRAC